MKKSRIVSGRGEGCAHMRKAWDIMAGEGMIAYNLDADSVPRGDHPWEDSARLAGMPPEVIAKCKQWDWMRKCNREGRSDMRTMEYELWQTEKRDDKGEVVRKEERIGGKREAFTVESASSTMFREEILQLHLEAIAARDLKFADVEVRARPFP